MLSRNGKKASLEIATSVKLAIHSARSAACVERSGLVRRQWGHQHPRRQPVLRTVNGSGTSVIRASHATRSLAVISSLMYATRALTFSARCAMAQTKREHEKIDELQPKPAT